MAATYVVRGNVAVGGRLSPPALFADKATIGRCRHSDTAHSGTITAPGVPMRGTQGDFALRNDRAAGAPPNVAVVDVALTFCALLQAARCV